MVPIGFAPAHTARLSASRQQPKPGHFKYLGVAAQPAAAEGFAAKPARDTACRVTRRQAAHKYSRVSLSRTDSFLLTSPSTMQPLHSLLFFSVAASGLGFGQKPLDNAAVTPSSNTPLTVSARDEVRVSRRAEIAELDVAVEACASDRSQAEENAHNDLQAVQRFLDHSGLDSTVTSAVKFQAGNDEQWAIPRCSRKAEKAPFDDDDDEDGEVCARASIAVTVRELEQLVAVVGNLTTSGSAPSVSVEYIDWQVSEATKAAMKAEMRRLAISNMAETGRMYAEALGVERLEFAGLEEQYSFVEARRVRRGGRWYGYGYGMDVETGEVPELEMMMEVTYRFST